MELGKQIKMHRQEVHLSQEELEEHYETTENGGEPSA